MSKDFSRTLNKHLIAAYEQGLREGVHQGIIRERQARQEKTLWFKLRKIWSRSTPSE